MVIAADVPVFVESVSFTVQSILKLLAASCNTTAHAQCTYALSRSLLCVALFPYTGAYVRKSTLSNGRPTWKCEVSRAVVVNDTMYSMYNSLTARKKSYMKSQKREVATKQKEQSTFAIHFVDVCLVACVFFSGRDVSM